jgi:hypothetical protein
MRLASKVRMNLSDRRNNNRGGTQGMIRLSDGVPRIDPQPLRQPGFAALREPPLAHRVISLLHSNLLASGVKRHQSQSRIDEYTP